MVTPGNIDDREPLLNESFVEQIFGKLVGDMEYISSFFILYTTNKFFISYPTNKTRLSITIKFNLVQVWEGGSKKENFKKGAPLFLFGPSFLTST